VTFQVCGCTHFRCDHPWDGRRYSSCEVCWFCGKTQKEHVFVTHQFKRCDCQVYQETA
jgi:hypothetical protein